MAHSEACELYIEQQIKEGLEDGQTPYFIGKHLSEDMDRIFNAKIKPNTLQTRAFRYRKRQSKVGVLPFEIVYFIQSGKDGPIKIGITRFSVSDRIATMQTGNPYKLRLIGVIKGNLEKESEIQRRFRKDRIRGEWFRPSIELMNYLKNKGDRYDYIRGLQVRD